MPAWSLGSWETAYQANMVGVSCGLIMSKNYRRTCNFRNSRMQQKSWANGPRSQRVHDSSQFQTPAILKWYLRHALNCREGRGPGSPAGKLPVLLPCDSGRLHTGSWVMTLSCLSFMWFVNTVPPVRKQSDRRHKQMGMWWHIDLISQGALNVLPY